MEPIRAFIAIELPDDLKAELARLIAKLKPGHERSVKWVDPEGIHLTLKFLGNVSTEKIVDITQAMKYASKEVRPFSLEMDGLGAFPNLKLPRVAWVGIGGDIRMVSNLQKQIDESLVPLGFSPEAKGFSPHLTLGRVRDRATVQERSELGKKLGLMAVEKRAVFSVDHVSLVKSTLTPDGAIYSQLAMATLDKS